MITTPRDYVATKEIPRLIAAMIPKFGFVCLFVFQPRMNLTCLQNPTVHSFVPFCNSDRHSQTPKAVLSEHSPVF